MNKELYQIYREDQEDRHTQPFPLDLIQRDRTRRQRVRHLLQAGMIQEPEDYFHASMVFQHGETVDDYWQAHILAKEAAKTSLSGARWLVAATYDRWLMCQGKPQKYGTQYRLDKDGNRKLWMVDPTTTDAERATWGVPPLTTLHERENPSSLMRSRERFGGMHVSPSECE